MELLPFPARYMSDQIFQPLSDSRMFPWKESEAPRLQGGACGALASQERQKKVERNNIVIWPCFFTENTIIVTSGKY
jgi:hypothetical protein